MEGQIGLSVDVTGAVEEDVGLSHPLYGGVLGLGMIQIPVRQVVVVVEHHRTEN